MDKDETQQRAYALNQKLTALLVNSQLGSPSPIPEALFGMRSSVLKPTAATILQGGEKRQVRRDNRFEEGLRKIEVDVYTRHDEVLDGPSTPFQTRSSSPYMQSLTWWRLQKSAVQMLGKVPKSAGDLLKRRNDTLKTIRKAIQRYAELDRNWVETRAHSSSLLQDDPGYYGPPENRPGESTSAPLEIDVDQYIRHPFISLNPVVAYLLLLVAVMSILGKLPQAWTSVLLAGLQRTFELLVATYHFDDTTSNYIRRIGKTLPKKIAQVQKKLQLEPPPHTIYATCPNNRCSRIYAPSMTDSWPELCTNSLPEGNLCSTALLRSVADASNTTFTRHPIRPFALYDVKAQIAELVTFEPTAGQLRRAPAREMEHRNEITDIFDGQLVRDFHGPKKGPGGSMGFFDAPVNERRLMFTLSVDWMNPNGVKAAGVVASVGVIALCCVNLPISACYKPENLILVGLIPGPQEPELDSINYFLKPLVDDFLILWKDGLKLKYSTTPSSGPVELVRAVILSLVTDMPASKKVAGNLSHAANAFCSLCNLRKGDMSNLEKGSWPKRTREEHRSTAFAWLKASREERKMIAQGTGIRFSEIFRLSYWDPTRQVVVDIMHNLFLGLIKRHYTKVLGMTNAARGGSYLYEPPKAAKLQAGRRILNLRVPNSQDKSLMRHCNWPELYALARECNILSEENLKHSRKMLMQHLEAWRLSSNARILDVDGPIPEMGAKSDPGGILDSALLLKIREAAKNMIIPTWFTRLPQTFGSASGGSLKADQWRVIATLYAPLVLIQEWPNNNPASHHWLKMTTDLMTSIYACSSHTVSDESLECYQSHLVSYLTILKTEFPKVHWVPNYHAALHIPDLLKDYGPAYGWWTFPFERLIRELQNVPTNSRMGELEQTMARSFYLGSRLRRYAYANQFGARTETVTVWLIHKPPAPVGSRV